jgi:hypothetical protein
VGALSPAKTWRKARRGPGQAAAAARAKSSLAEREGHARERARARGPTAEGIRNQVVPRTNAQIDLLRAWGSGKGTRPARRL